MGIKGLLKVLENGVAEEGHVGQLGERVGIDGYCWLHRASYSCAKEVALGGEGAARRIGEFFSGRLRGLYDSGVRQVYVVFDGARLPAKELVNERRGADRQRAKDQAVEALRQGQLGRAAELFQKAVHISPLLVHRVATRLRREFHAKPFTVIIAPHEADAQLAQLCRAGLVDGVISEDSDLLAFGCPRVLFKMDHSGRGRLVDMARLGLNRDPCFAGFTPAMFRRTCMLAGCDYLPSLPGVGVKKAHALVRAARDHLPDLALALAPLVPSPAALSDYLSRFLRAEFTFLHQPVFDLSLSRAVPLTPYPHPLPSFDFSLSSSSSSSPSDSMVDIRFAGTILSPEISLAISRSEIDPNTHEPFPVDSLPPDTLPSLPPSRAFLTSSSSSASASAPSVLWRSRRAQSFTPSSPAVPISRKNILITSFFSPLSSTSSAASSSSSEDPCTITIISPDQSSSSSSSPPPPSPSPSPPPSPTEPITRSPYFAAANPRKKQRNNAVIDNNSGELDEIRLVLDAPIASLENQSLSERPSGPWSPNAPTSRPQHPVESFAKGKALFVGRSPPPSPSKPLAVISRLHPL